MKYKFQDFIDSAPPESPEDASRIDVLSREMQTLREQVSDLESLKSDLRNTEKWIEDWFRKSIAQLSADAAKKFAEQVDSELLVTAFGKAGIQQVVEQAVEAIFQREAQLLYEAVCRAVLKRLGRG